MPRREATASAFPSCEPHRRARPSTTVADRGWFVGSRLVEQVAVHEVADGRLGRAEEPVDGLPIGVRCHERLRR